VNNECDGNEKPGRKVRVNAFAIDRTEVTVAAYGACVKRWQVQRPGWRQRGRS
jgi:formylglycine-generating enzyme required for sulfatase activity